MPKTKWIVNNNKSCVDKNMDFTCSKDVYWKVEVDEDGDIIKVVSDLEACKKHLKENGVEMKRSS